MAAFLKIAVLMLGINFLLPAHSEAIPSPSRYEQISSYSQASQDRFVHLLLYGLLGKQDEGYYLEIGAGHPSKTSNTYSLETNFGWRGISIDISDEYQESWRLSRQNPLLIEDATQSDYRSILKSFPQVIDYLSLDIDNDYDIVLGRIPFDEHVFKLITIEHDFYRYGDKYRQGEREILASLGYYLLCPNVSLFFGGKDAEFEDWWIHPSVFPEDELLLLLSLHLKAKNHGQIIQAIETLLSAKKI